MNKTRKQALESTLSTMCGVTLEITFARDNEITLSWEGKNEKAFNKLQRFFNGKLFDYEFDEEIDFSVCCLKFQ